MPNSAALKNVRDTRRRDRPDPETTEIAAQVGQLVLSTLHTDVAAGTVRRMVDLGVPEFLRRDVLRGVLRQKLQLAAG